VAALSEDNRPTRWNDSGFSLMRAGARDEKKGVRIQHTLSNSLNSNNSFNNNFNKLPARNKRTIEAATSTVITLPHV
jgi:hypothetical protein